MDPQAGRTWAWAAPPAALGQGGWREAWPRARVPCSAGGKPRLAPTPAAAHPSSVFQFKNPLILLLLGSALVSVLTQEYEDAVSIAMVSVWAPGSWAGCPGRPVSAHRGKELACARNESGTGRKRAHAFAPPAPGRVRPALSWWPRGCCAARGAAVSSLPAPGWRS